MTYENQGIGPPVCHFRTSPVGGLVTGAMPWATRGNRRVARPRGVRFRQKAPTSGSGDLAVAGLTMVLVLAVTVLFLLFKYVVLVMAVSIAAYALSRMPRRKGHSSAWATSPVGVGRVAGSILGGCVRGIGPALSRLGTVLMEGFVSGSRAAGSAVLVILTVSYRIVAVAFSILLSLLFLSFLFSLFGGRDK